MNKKDFVKLCFNYSKEPNEELYELWNYNLRPYDEEEIRQAINRIIATDRYFPTFSKILESVKEVVARETLESGNDVYIINRAKKFNIKPICLNKEITNEEIDEKDQKEFDDFKRFINYIRMS